MNFRGFLAHDSLQILARLWAELHETMSGYAKFAKDSGTFSAKTERYFTLPAFQKHFLNIFSCLPGIFFGALKHGGDFWVNFFLVSASWETRKSRRRKRLKTNGEKMVDFWCRFFTVYAELFTVYTGHKR